ncbi:hypothetical protein R69658_07997 [Paraburkholderia aspalathi]|uniref:Uncharacterized protein n=1 Tax=Paraburkholderia aspalathi TaxID=1324617 RepID=A0ABM8T9G7_9BURK|nr:hypothetical protein R69658_07997 [Paraburkholderia aspalathi]
MKSTNGQSLRCQVEKWLAPTPATPVRVTAFSRTRLGGRRYVCVESACYVALNLGFSGAVRLGIK